MTRTCAICCDHCGAPIGDPHLSFDRRIEYASVQIYQGQPNDVVNIVQDESLKIFCSHACWHETAPELAKALVLKYTYPAFTHVTPCSRCAKPINRSKPYVCYNLSEIAMEDGDVMIGHCIDNNDFAVLCPECEKPQSPAVAESAHDINEAEGVLE